MEFPLQNDTLIRTIQPLAWLGAMFLPPPMDMLPPSDIPPDILWDMPPDMPPDIPPDMPPPDEADIEEDDLEEE